MAHIPGPWAFDDRLPNRSILITANGGIEKIAKVADSFDNARLIAAAPDLLAACRSLLSAHAADYEAFPDHASREAHALANAAIAKANG